MLGVTLLYACGGESGRNDDPAWGDATSPALFDAAAPSGDAGGAADAQPFDAQPPLDAVVVLDANTGGDSAAADASLTDAMIASDGATPSDATRAPDATSDPVMPDAAKPDAAAPNGVCGGNTPHGCWPPKPGNPMGCPAQIHEQSAFYPPLEEWEACSSPYYAACIYLRPDGSEANCSCDLGLHWLCTY